MCGLFPSIIKKSSVLRKMQQQLKHKIHSDMPALLLNPVVNFHTQTPGQKHISPYAKVDEVYWEFCMSSDTWHFCGMDQFLVC